MSLLEQDVAEVEETGVEETDVEVDVEEVEQEPPAPGQQAIAELIAAAFAYLPTDDDADTIENIELLLVGTHNEAPPISNINPRGVIIDIVAKLPRHLRAVYERGVNTRGLGIGGGLKATDEIYLAQILADAFRYRPTPQDALIASAVSEESSESDPTNVIETVQRLLQFSDEDVQDDLQDINIDNE